MGWWRIKKKASHYSRKPDGLVKDKEKKASHYRWNWLEAKLCNATIADKWIIVEHYFQWITAGCGWCYHTDSVFVLMDIHCEESIAEHTSAKSQRRHTFSKQCTHALLMVTHCLFQQAVHARPTPRNSLCFLLPFGLSRTFGVIYGYSYSVLEITWLDTRPQVKWVVCLVIADGYFSLTHGFVWVSCKG